MQKQRGSNPKSLKKAFWYGRNSTTHQDGSEQQQRNVCYDYANKKGYEIVKDYYDFAYSGTNINRPQFQLMMEQLKRSDNDVHYIITYSSDRISRSIYDSLEFQKKLELYDVVLISVTQPFFEEDTAESNLNKNIGYAISQYHVDNTRRLVTRAMREIANSKKFTGGIPCYGLTVNEDKDYIINEEEAGAIRIIFQMVANNDSYKDIVEVLRKKGYKKRNGECFKKTDSFNDFIRNPKYKGEYCYMRTFKNKRGKYNQHKERPLEQQIRFPNAIPAIVSEELWEEANRVLNSRRHRQGSGNSKEYYLLSGKIYCSCGSPMYGNNRKDGSGRYPYATYGCSSKHRTTECKGISRDNLEGYVVSALKYYFKDETTIAILRYVVDYVIKKYYLNSDEEIKKANFRLKGIQKKIDNLVSNLSKITQQEIVDTIINNIESLEENKKNLEKEIASLKNRSIYVPKVTESDIRTMLDKTFDNMSHTTNRRRLAHIIDKVVNSVIVYNDRVQLNFELDFLLFKGISQFVRLQVTAMRTEIKKGINCLYYELYDVGNDEMKINYKIRMRKGIKQIQFQNGVYQEVRYI